MERTNRVHILVKDIRQKRHEDSVLYNNLKAIAYVQIPAGIFHIRRISSPDPDEMYVKLKSCRTLYSLLTLSYTFVTSLIFIIILGRIEYSLINRNDISAIVFVGLAIRLEITTIFSHLMSLVKSKDLMYLLQTMIKLEKKRSWKKGERIELMVISRLVSTCHVLWLMIIIVTLMVKSSMLGEPYWSDTLHKYLFLSVLGVILFLNEYYTAVSIIYTPAWVTYLTVYFFLIFRSIERELSEMLPRVKLSSIRKLRMLYLEACNLIEKLDDVFSLSVLELYAGNIIFCCLSSFYMLKKDVAIFDRLIFLASFLGSFGLMLFPALSCSFMKRELNSIATTLNKFHFDPEDSQCREQVFAFIVACQTYRPSITGWKFFDVDLPLMVSIAATIATYSIILAQSG